MGRGRRTLWAIPGAALLAVPLLALAPATRSPDARRYLDPAVRVLGLQRPGETVETPPTWTTCVSYPIAAVEWVRGPGRRGPAAGRQAAATEDWTGPLRVLWAFLLALVLLEAGRFAVRTCRGETASGGTRATLVAGTATAALLAASRFGALAVAHLHPAVPAALLLFLLLRIRTAWLRGIVAGMLLAWFGYLWPLTVLALLLPQSARVARQDPGASGRMSLAWVLGIALVLAWGLTPDRLLHPGGAPGRFLAEWRREGGLGGPGGAGWLPLLSLAVAFGPLVWAGWPIAEWRQRRATVRNLVPAGAILLCLGLPMLLGLRQPGAVQWSVVPLLAAWSLGGVMSILPPRPGRVGIGIVLGIAFVLSAIPGRQAGDRGASSVTQAQGAVRAEIGDFVGSGDLVVAEADPWAAESSDSPPAPGERAPARPGLLILPRDSRTPGRYDDLYWPRWYAGFRWVLLSGARVRENLSRAEAAGPRLFYSTVEQEGRLMREWGTGGLGFRLYRIPEESPWGRPLHESEVAALRPTPERVWFLSRLGSAYLDAGQSALAEEIFRLATKWDPENAPAWNNLGAAFLRRDDYPAAAKAFDKGLKRAPDSVELLLNYGRACSAQGIYERGESYLLRALALRPDYAPVHYELARVFIGQGKEAAAAEALRRTLALDPSTPQRREIESVLSRLTGGAAGAGGAP